MNEQAQRIAIGKFCGWHPRKWNRNTFAGKVPVNGWSKIPESEIPNPEYPWDKTCVEELPDYLRDLNAVHEAESHLQCGYFFDYIGWLIKLANKVHQNSTPSELTYDIVHASPKLRSEAILRTIHQWRP